LLLYFPLKSASLKKVAAPVEDQKPSADAATIVARETGSGSRLRT
jgi:hypothetical protein